MLALYQETLISTARRFLPGQSKKKKNNLQKKKPKSTRMGEMHQPLQETNIYQEFLEKRLTRKKKVFVCSVLISVSTFYITFE